MKALIEAAEALVEWVLDEEKPNQLTDNLRAAIASAKAAEEETKWIDVRDELPYGEDHLLLLDGEPTRMLVGYGNRVTKCWMVQSVRLPGLPVTHWQPLPAPPVIETREKEGL